MINVGETNIQLKINIYYFKDDKDIEKQGLDNSKR